MSLSAPNTLIAQFTVGDEDFMLSSSANHGSLEVRPASDPTDLILIFDDKGMVTSEKGRIGYYGFEGKSWVYFERPLMTRIQLKFMFEPSMIEIATRHIQALKTQAINQLENYNA